MTEEKVFVLGIVLGAILAIAILSISYWMICAWCGKELHPVKGISEDSHGVCPECADKLLNE